MIMYINTYGGKSVSLVEDVTLGFDVVSGKEDRPFYNKITTRDEDTIKLLTKLYDTHKKESLHFFDCYMPSSKWFKLKQVHISFISKNDSLTAFTLVSHTKDLCDSSEIPSNIKNFHNLSKLKTIG
jgi:hypothetical protein